MESGIRQKVPVVRLVPLHLDGRMSNRLLCIRWYNKPYIAPRKPSARTHSTAPSLPQEQDTDDPDTAPLDFGTYVPTHDPSLAIQSDEAAASLTTATAPFFVPPPSTMMVSRDEAFQNALSAMYWSGYWTAVYHVCHCLLHAFLF